MVSTNRFRARMKVWDANAHRQDETLQEALKYGDKGPERAFFPD